VFPGGRPESKSVPVTRAGKQGFAPCKFASASSDRPETGSPAAISDRLRPYGHVGFDCWSVRKLTIAR
jgi:hypothetical protein